MNCPNCHTANRDERTECYQCEADLRPLRLVVNRSRTHYNNALEHAERDRPEEAIAELRHALENDASFVDAWVVLGTLHAKEERFEEAREAWNRALALDPRYEKAHRYLGKAERVSASLPALRRLRAMTVTLAILTLLAAGVAAVSTWNLIKKNAERRTLGEIAGLMSGGAGGEALARGEAHARLTEEMKAGAFSAMERDIAEQFLVLIESDFESRVGALESGGGDFDFVARLAGVGAIEGMNPPERFQDRLTDLREGAFAEQFARIADAIARRDFGEAMAEMEAATGADEERERGETIEGLQADYDDALVAEGSERFAEWKAGEGDLNGLMAAIEELFAFAPGAGESSLDPLSPRGRLAGLIGEAHTEQIARVEGAIGRHDFAEARAGMETVAGANGGHGSADVIEGLKAAFEEALTAEAGERLSAWESGERDLNRLTAEIEELLAFAAQGGEAIREIESMLEEALAEDERAFLEEAGRLIDAAETAEQAAAAADDAAAEREALGDAIEAALMARLESVELKQRMDAFDEALDREDVAAAEAALDAMRELYSGLNRIPPAASIGAAAGRLEDAKRTEALEGLRIAFGRGDMAGWIQVMDATEDDRLESAGWNEEQLGALEELREDSIRLWAEAMKRWHSDHDGAIESRSVVPPAKAREMIDRLDLYLEQLKKDMGDGPSRSKRAEAIYHAAWGRLQFRERDQARRLVERLREEHGDSEILKYPAFKALEQLIDPEQVDPPQAAEPPAA